jgi:hypothetical protein
VCGGGGVGLNPQPNSWPMHSAMWAQKFQKKKTRCPTKFLKDNKAMHLAFHEDLKNIEEVCYMSLISENFEFSHPTH